MSNRIKHSILSNLLQPQAKNIYALSLPIFVLRTFSIPTVNLMMSLPNSHSPFYHTSPPPNTLHLSQVLENPLPSTKQTSKKPKRGRHWSAGLVGLMFPWSTLFRPACESEAGAVSNLSKCFSVVHWLLAFSLCAPTGNCWITNFLPSYTGLHVISKWWICYDRVRR